MNTRATERIFNLAVLPDTNQFGPLSHKRAKFRNGNLATAQRRRPHLNSYLSDKTGLPVASVSISDNGKRGMVIGSKGAVADGAFLTADSNS